MHITSSRFLNLELLLCCNARDHKMLKNNVCFSDCPFLHFVVLCCFLTISISRKRSNRNNNDEKHATAAYVKSIIYLYNNRKKEEL